MFLIPKLRCEIVLNFDIFQFSTLKMNEYSYLNLNVLTVFYMLSDVLS